MNKVELDAAMAALDAALALTDYFIRKINEWKAEGVVLPPEQQAKLDRIEAIRAEVGTPPAAPPA